MDSPEHDFVVVDNTDVVGTDSSGNQPLLPAQIQTIKDWIQPNKYNARSSEYKRHLGSYVLGTDALLQDPIYRQWLDSVDQGALWLTAIPGAGKSVVAAHLVAHLEEQVRAPVLFFFFRQIITSNRNPSSMMRDWMAQVLEWSPYLQTRLYYYIEEGLDYEEVALDELWQALSKALYALPRVFCVADALDEMSTGNDSFIQQLIALGAIKPSTLKICITSRPVPRIEQIRRSTAGFHITMTASMLRPAIIKYIDYRLANLDLPRQTAREVAQTLLAKSDGLFLYVKHMMDELLLSTSAASRLPAQLKASVENLPTGLSQMYTRILQEHSARANVPQSLQTAILRWVTHSARPLRVLELAVVADSLIDNELLEKVPELRVMYSNTKAVIRVACGPLIHILEDETVSIIHHSLTEYAVSASRNDSTTIERNTGDFPIIDTLSSHREMAMTCLRYLCIVWQPDTPPIKDKEDSNVGLYAQFPFLRYASRYWSHHARHVSSADKHLFELLDKFTDRNSPYLCGWTDLTADKWNKYSGTVLHLAAKEGLSAYVEHLIDNGNDVNSKDSKDATPLHSASRQGHAETVRVLVGKYGDTDIDDEAGLRPLHLAALGGHADVIRILLEAGVHPMTWKTKEHPGRWCGSGGRSVGHTPVQYAFHAGHEEAAMVFAPHLSPKDLLRATHWAMCDGKTQLVTRVLTNYTVDLDKRIEGRTLVYLAAQNHDPSLLRKLGELGADFDIRCDDDFHPRRCYSAGDDRIPRSTPLHAFALGSHEKSNATDYQRANSRQALSILLRSGCRLDAKDKAGNQPLHVALNGSTYDESPDVDLIEAFLDEDADPCALNGDGYQPIHMPSCDEEIIQRLLFEGASVNAKVKSIGKSVLHLCIEGRSSKESWETLLKAGADPNTQDLKGNTALHSSLQESRAWADKSAHALLEYGADPTLINEDLQTALHTMRSIGCDDDTKMLVDKLIESGANLEARDITGKTVLMRLMGDWTLKPETIALLVGKEAKLETRDHEGTTVLLQLCDSRRSAPLISALMELGANQHATDFQGNNAFHHLARQQRETYYGSEQTALFELILKLELFASSRPSWIDLEDRNGHTALYYACASGRVESVRILFQAGASTDVSSDKGLSLLSACADFAGHTDSTPSQKIDSLGIRPIVRLLIEQGVSVTHRPATVRGRPTISSCIEKAIDHERKALLDEILLHIENLSLDGNLRERPRNSLCLSPRRELVAKSLGKYLSLERDTIDKVIDTHTTDGRLYEPYGQRTLFDHLLRTENEPGLIQLCERRPEVLVAQSEPFKVHENLENLVIHGHAQSLALLAPSPSGLMELMKDEVVLRDWYDKSPLLNLACGRYMPNLGVLEVLVEEKEFNLSRMSKRSFSSSLFEFAGAEKWWSAQGMEYLHGHGADIDVKDKDGQTSLHVAIAKGCIRNVETLLRLGADTGLIGIDGLTCLNRAWESPKMVRLLLQHGADVKACQYPFIFDAIRLRDLGIVSTVVAKGADLNTGFDVEQLDHQSKKHFDFLHKLQNKSPRKVYPIQVAASYLFNNPEAGSDMRPIIQHLLRNGADVTLHCDPQYPIRHALCEHGGRIHLLLDQVGLDLELRDARGNTLLLAACLHSTGNSCTNRDLDTAINKKQPLESIPSSVSLLLGRGANLSALNNERQNALHCLLSESWIQGKRRLRQKTLKTILSAPGAENLINQADSAGMTPILLALRNGWIDFANLLLNHGADPTAKDHLQNTTLHYLMTKITNKHRDSESTARSLFKYLLTLGISINSRNISGETPLFVAMKHASLSLDELSFFYNLGADINTVDSENRNLLHLTAQKKRRAVVIDRSEEAYVILWRRLIGLGLDPASEDREQKSSWDYAVAAGNEDLLVSCKKK
ncbi:MAG: hypothetical protein Q9168_007043 [Polycauliona sp. 1 TL-2023]